MAKKFLSQDHEDSQPLRLDSTKRFIVNDSNDWQFLFAPDSAFISNPKLLKVAAEFNKDTFDSIRFAAYLYNNEFGTISAMGSCQFNVYLITTPTWTEQFIGAFPGAQIFNSYFFVDVPTASLVPVDFFGGDTIMLEAVAVRLGKTYRERIYVNHLGIYLNAFQLRQDIDFLNVTKQDL